jgi:hypothetical protein
MLGRLLMLVGASTSWGYGGVPMALNIFINTRIDTTIRKIQRIAESIRAGTYKFRPRSPNPRDPTSPAVRRPPRPPPLVEQKFGWLMPLLPMEYWNANGYRAGVESVFEDPEMVALIQAAPVTLGRPLRSLCWMFRIKPPPILARPRRPRSCPTPPAAPAAASPHPDAASRRRDQRSARPGRRRQHHPPVPPPPLRRPPAPTTRRIRPDRSLCFHTPISLRYCN